jgi:MYXO-CTERM domain-containing protein
VAPGDTFEFKFDFHAPPTAGTYTEYFGVVVDGVAWFSDPGQGGPPDTDLEANIDVTAGATNCTADPGVPDGGSHADGDGGTTTGDGGDAGKTTGDAAAGSDGGVMPGDAAVGEESGKAPPGDAAPQSPSHEGGGCSATGAGSGLGAAGWALMVVALVAARRRRGGALSSCCPPGSSRSALPLRTHRAWSSGRSRCT